MLRAVVRVGDRGLAIRRLEQVARAGSKQQLLPSPFVLFAYIAHGAFLALHTVAELAKNFRWGGLARET